MNTKSSIGAQDPQLIMSLLLQCLMAAEDEQATLNIAKTLVQDPAYLSDDRLWEALEDVYSNGDAAM